MVGIEMISRNLNPGQDKREMMQVKTALYRDGHTVPLMPLHIRRLGMDQLGHAARRGFCGPFRILGLFATLNPRAPIPLRVRPFRDADELGCRICHARLG
jgi:hypothetical protein